MLVTGRNDMRGWSTRTLNLTARQRGLVAIVREADGTELQTRIIRVRRVATVLEGLVAYSGQWLEIRDLWSA
jgi:hypothetical protein